LFFCDRMPSTSPYLKSPPRVLVVALLLILVLLTPPLPSSAAAPAAPAACPAVLIAGMEDIPADRLAELAATAQALVAPGKGILVS